MFMENRAAKPVEIVIVGRNAIIREGLGRILSDVGFSVSVTQPDHTGSYTSPEVTNPDVIIIDASNANEGVETAALLRSAYPDARLVVMAESYDLPTVARAFSVGVDGYLVKAIGCNALVSALHLILLGEKIVPSQTLEVLAEMPAKGPAVNRMTPPVDVSLTEREIEILGHLVQGDANKIISRRLTITEATVKVHVKAILRKLHVMNRTQAAIWAISNGLFSVEGERGRAAA